MRVSVAALVAGLTIATAGCGGSDKPAPRPGSDGRPLGTSPETASWERARAAAVDYVNGLLAFRRGEIPASKVPNAQPAVRRALEKERTPPGLQKARDHVAKARITAATPDTASVDVTVENARGETSYVLPIVLVREGDRWLASEAGRE